VESSLKATGGAWLPLLFESNAAHHQFVSLDDPKADYSFFDQAYAFEKDLWHPNGDHKRVSGFDIGKLIVKTTEFVDSKSDILLQAADILANRARRCFQDVTFDDQTAADLGRLQIVQARQGAQQVVKIISLTNHKQSSSQSLRHRLKLMNTSARTMFPRALYDEKKSQ
jgi:hypothetical protein